MIRAGQLVCDGCGKTITRITTAVDEAGAPMHNLCSECFRDLRKRSLPRA